MDKAVIDKIMESMNKRMDLIISKKGGKTNSLSCLQLLLFITEHTLCNVCYTLNYWHLFRDTTIQLWKRV